MRIYNSLVNSIGVNGHTTLSIYHCDETLFIREFQKSLDAYDYYVIMPHFRDIELAHSSSTDAILKEIERIPKNKLIILDNDQVEIKGNYGAINQDFKNDIYRAFKEGKDKLKNFDKLILVYPRPSVLPYPMRILRGFICFCDDHNFDYKIF